VWFPHPPFHVGFSFFWTSPFFLSPWKTLWSAPPTPVFFRDPPLGVLFLHMPFCLPNTLFAVPDFGGPSFFPAQSAPVLFFQKAGCLPFFFCQVFGCTPRGTFIFYPVFPTQPPPFPLFFLFFFWIVVKVALCFFFPLFCEFVPFFIVFSSFQGVCFFISFSVWTRPTVLPPFFPGLVDFFPPRLFVFSAVLFFFLAFFCDVF